MKNFSYNKKVGSIYKENSTKIGMATKCKHGRLKSPVREKDGSMRRCKLPKKTRKGRSQDRKHKSHEFHEVRYRKDKRRGKR